MPFVHNQPGPRASDAASALEDAPPEECQVRGRVQQYEAKPLLDTLAAAGWNRTEAALRLGMPVRPLSCRMKVLGVKRPS